ncbi:hypothetical protein [Azorhizobium caulinodans]|uniref:hypothetical protein n=1 Tax=Azorhizobium caulinodans TaxID=7 RepID=UPI002FBE3A58
MSEIDFTKPVCTRDFRSVRILCTDGPLLSEPVLGIVDGKSEVFSWRENGRYDPACFSGLDIINVTPEFLSWAQSVSADERTLQSAFAAGQRAALEHASNAGMLVPPGENEIAAQTAPELKGV